MSWRSEFRLASSAKPRDVNVQARAASLFIPKRNPNLAPNARQHEIANMAIISAGTMIRSLSLFHVTLAAVLLRNPAIVAKQSIVLVLGQSMQLVRLLYPPSNRAV
jgi:hypothetical protein